MKKILLVILLWIGSLNLYSQYSVDQPMNLIEVNGVSIAYTTSGEEENTPVLMIMGPVSYTHLTLPTICSV